MDNRKLRIYLAMFLALILVTQTKNIVTFMAKQDFKGLFASLQKPPDTGRPSGSIEFDRISPTTAPTPFFAPTTAVATPAPQPTAKPVVTTAPTKVPTKAPTKIPTKVPTNVPTKAPTAVPTLKPGPAVGASKSKLSEFMIGSYTAGAKAILEANPQLIKVIDPTGDNAFFDGIRAYKQRVPGGIAIVRFYEGGSGAYYTAANDPAASAEDFFRKVIKPGIDGLGSNKSLFDYIQSPNEYDSTPEWKGETNMKWEGKFWRRLTELAGSAGMRMCIAGIPVGNIDPPELGFIIDDLRVMKQAGDAFCYHGYTFNLSEDVDHEIWYSLRYRLFYNYFRENAPDLADMPLILSEGGVAGNGDAHAGYQQYGGAAQFEEWLKWYDSEIRKDSYVKGVTLFQIGNDSDWGAFNLEPIAGWMSDYLRSQK